MLENTKEINHASVETTRPPIYTAMKYWGKKPHNIWAEYIENYTPEDGVILDPFCGSGISVIESLRLERSVIGFDLNPLSSFIIVVITCNFNEKQFKQAYDQIVANVKSNPLYKELYEYKGRYIHHAKWEDGSIYEIGFIEKDLDGKEKNLSDALIQLIIFMRIKAVVY